MSEISIYQALAIYRKFVSNLAIRDILLSQTPSKYAIGPSLIWVESPSDISLFTSAGVDNYLTFDHPHDNPRSPKYLKRMLLKQRMTKGSILIKEQTPENAPIKVHFCAYTIDQHGVFTVFDPSWHSADPGIYSTTAFYESLDAFRIPYVHAEYNRAHHWQSVLRNDVFCQTWTLAWLLFGTEGGFPLPTTRNEVSVQLAKYIHRFVQLIRKTRKRVVPLFPVYKWDGCEPEVVFDRIRNDTCLEKTIEMRF